MSIEEENAQEWKDFYAWRDAQVKAKGLTKRELFAAIAIQGMLANPDGINRVWKKAKELNPDDLEGAATDAVEEHLVERAFSLADRIADFKEKSAKEK